MRSRWKTSSDLAACRWTSRPLSGAIHPRHARTQAEPRESGSGAAARSGGARSEELGEDRVRLEFSAATLQSLKRAVGRLEGLVDVAQRVRARQEQVVIRVQVHAPLQRLDRPAIADAEVR